MFEDRNAVTNMAGYCANSRDTRRAASLGLLIYVDVVQQMHCIEASVPFIWRMRSDIERSDHVVVRRTGWTKGREDRVWLQLDRRHRNIIDTRTFAPMEMQDHYPPIQTCLKLNPKSMSSTK